MGVGDEIAQALPRAAFFDRDGVLNRALIRNHKPYPPQTLDDFSIVDGAKDALDRLKALGYAIFVVSNQPDVARGTQDRAVVERMNAVLRDALPVDEIYTCFHDDKDDCECRKPKPGLILRAAEEHGVDLRHSFMIGDRWRDVAAGQRAGVRTVFLDYDYDERQPDPPADKTVSKLADAVDWIASHS
jgi:D-glycero-D-manno-heptose 1,7-bisphosphate phosphatase